jgi:hypothetical protein
MARKKQQVGALASATGLSDAELHSKVSRAYEAKYGVPMGTVYYDDVTVGEDTRVYFNVVSGANVIGQGVYKPKRGSLWIEWA